MNNIKLHAKNEQDIDSLIHLNRMFSSDINRSKVKSTSEISLPEGQIDNIDGSYNFLGILQLFGKNDKEVRCKATFEYRN